MSTPLVSIVIPTYNEAAGLPALVAQVTSVLQQAGIEGEVVIVDDNSPDGTGRVADELATRYPLQVVHRSGKLGLSSAVIEGWKAARGQVLGVMDADLSHDPGILPDLVLSVTEGRAEVAVGSRYIPGGGMKDWPAYRQFISRTAVWMGRLLCPVADVTSGFFVLRRGVIEGVQLDPIGFKIGLEVFMRGRYRYFTEVPYVFTDRTQGKSKLSWKEVRNYLVQLGRLLWHWLKTRPRRERVPYLQARTAVQRRR